MLRSASLRFSRLPKNQIKSLSQKSTKCFSSKVAAPATTSSKDLLNLYNNLLTLSIPNNNQHRQFSTNVKTNQQQKEQNSEQQQQVNPNKLKKKRSAKKWLLILGAIAVIAPYLDTQKEKFRTPESVVAAIRFLRAFYTLAQVIFDYKWSLYNVTDEKERAQILSKVHKRSAERILHLCLQNGCIYVKAGQHIASLNQILPPEYTVTMQPVLDKAKTRPFHEMRELFRKEFGKDIEEMFATMSETPIAAASLAQVYEAYMKDGQKVAVKMQYPSLANTVEQDLKVFDLLVDTAEYFFPEAKLKWLVEEFKINLPYELDFRKEGKNCEKLESNIKQHFDNVRCPKVYWSHTSERIITLEFIDGVKIHNKQGLLDLNADPAEVADLIAKVFSTQIFQYGFVHCDPHSGNIFVTRKKTKSGKPGKLELVIIDHGLYQTYDDDFRTRYAELWRAIIARDQKQVAEIGKQLGITNPELFSVMLTCRAWDSNDVGINQKITKEEYEYLLQYGQDNFFNITQVLSNVNRQVLLLLKCNDLLRCLQAELGIPVNYFTTFADYAMYNIAVQKSKKAGMNIFAKIKAYWEYCSFKVMLWLHDLWMKWFYFPEQKKDLEFAQNLKQFNNNTTYQQVKI